LAGSAKDITHLLSEWRRGDENARDELAPLVYEELRRIAHRHMRGERPDRTLQSSALVNEAWLRLHWSASTGRTACTSLPWRRA
jgi:hypothetical protein